MDISKCVRGSLRLRDNKSLSYIFLIVFRGSKSSTVTVSLFSVGGPSGELLPNNPQKCTGENITFTCKANGHSSSRLKFKLNDNGSLPDNATVIIDDSTRSMTLTDLTMGEHHLNILCCMNDCNKSSDIVGSTQLLRMYGKLMNGC